MSGIPLFVPLLNPKPLMGPNTLTSTFIPLACAYACLACTLALLVVKTAMMIKTLPMDLRQTASRRCYSIRGLLPFALFRTVSDALYVVDIGRPYPSNTELTIIDFFEYLALWFFFCLKLGIIFQWAFVASTALRPKSSNYIDWWKRCCAAVALMFFLLSVLISYTNFVVCDGEATIHTAVAFTIGCVACEMVAAGVVMVAFAVVGVRIYYTLKQATRRAKERNIDSDKVVKKSKRINTVVALLCVLSFAVRFTACAVQVAIITANRFICVNQDLLLIEHNPSRLETFLSSSILPIYVILEVIPSFSIAVFVYLNICEEVTKSSCLLAEPLVQR